MKAQIGVRFAGRDKLVHLVGNGEAPLCRRRVFAERLDGAGQIGQGITDWNQLAALTLHGFYSPMFLRQARGATHQRLT